MLILLGAIFALHIIGIILLLVATIDNVSASNRHFILFVFVVRRLAKGWGC